MTVVSSQYGFIDEGNNAVRLAQYAQYAQVECAFFGVANPADPIDEACNPIVMLPERVMTAFYLKEAQEEIEQVTGYPLSPRWFTDQLPYAATVHAKQMKLIEIGVEATEIVLLGTAVSHATDPATVGPLATTVTDPAEIHVYHVGTLIEIDPSSITIAAGNVTIQIPRCRMVKLANINNPDDGLDYTDVPPSATSPFESAVDIRRVYNDDQTQGTFIWPHQSGSTCTCGCAVCEPYTHEACAWIRNAETGAIDLLYAHLVGSVWTAQSPCVCTLPQLVNVNYRAGLTELTAQAMDAVIHLAHAKMPRPSCGCGILRDRWDADRAVPASLTIEQANCPFGTMTGSWLAWRYANAMRNVRMGTL